MSIAFQCDGCRHLAPGVAFAKITFELRESEKPFRNEYCKSCKEKIVKFMREEFNAPMSKIELAARGIF